MAREAGAKKVYFASSSPPVTYVTFEYLLIISPKRRASHPHIYGIDLATSRELVAHQRDRKGIAESINADEVVYLSLEDLEAACAELSPRHDQRFEVGVFCGRYVTPVPDGYLEKLGMTRSKPGALESKQSGAFVTVGDSMTKSPTGFEPSDVSLHNLLSDQL